MPIGYCIGMVKPNAWAIVVLVLVLVAENERALTQGTSQALSRLKNLPRS